MSADSCSVPPEVKAINARSAAVQACLGLVTEIVGMVCATWLLATGAISEGVWLSVVGWCLTGTVIGKARGKLPASLTALALASPFVAKALGAAAKGAGISALVLLTGCAAIAPYVAPALTGLVPIAVAELQKVLRDKPAAASEEGVCVWLPDDYQPDGAVLVACVAADMPRLLKAASIAVVQAGESFGVEVDANASDCTKIDAGGKLHGVVAVCRGPEREQ